MRLQDIEDQINQLTKEQHLLGVLCDTTARVILPQILQLGTEANLAAFSAEIAEYLKATYPGAELIDICSHGGCKIDQLTGQASMHFYAVINRAKS